METKNVNVPLILPQINHLLFGLTVFGKECGGMEAASGVFPHEIPGSSHSRSLAFPRGFKSWSSGIAEVSGPSFALTEVSIQCHPPCTSKVSDSPALLPNQQLPKVFTEEEK